MDTGWCGTQTRFQFTPLREGRPLRDVGAYHVAVFQFTPLREGRLAVPLEVAPGSDFNSRPCVRGDLRETRRM